MESGHCVDAKTPRASAVAKTVETFLLHMPEEFVETPKALPEL
jgi:hypothetical protein